MLIGLLNCLSVGLEKGLLWYREIVLDGGLALSSLRTQTAQAFADHLETPGFERR
jgi:hypothetical protein